MALASASHAISVVDADADAVSVVDANDAVSDDAVLAFAVLAFASDDAMLAFASASRAQRRRCNRRHVGRRRACVRVAQQQNKIGGAPAGSCSLSDLHVTALITSTFPHVPWRATARLAASSGSITSAKHVSSRSVASNTARVKSASSGSINNCNWVSTVVLVAILEYSPGPRATVVRFSLFPYPYRLLVCRKVKPKPTTVTHTWFDVNAQDTFCRITSTVMLACSSYTWFTNTHSGFHN